jgi:hypothetical protein
MATRIADRLDAMHRQRDANLAAQRSTGTAAAGIALAAWQLTRGFYSSVKPLYGASAWASEAEMLSAGIKQSRSPY